MNTTDPVTMKTQNTHLEMQIKVLNARILDLHMHNSQLKNQLANLQLECITHQKSSSTTQTQLLTNQKQLNDSMRKIQQRLTVQMEENTNLLNDNQTLNEQVQILTQKMELFTHKSPEFLIKENQNLTRKNAEFTAIIERQSEDIENLNKGFLGHSKLYSQIKTLKQALNQANEELKYLRSKNSE